MIFLTKMFPRLTIRTVAAAALLLSSSVSALSDWQQPPAGVVSRIAFGSCAMQWKPQPIWNTIKAQGPDLFLFLGDAIYGDFDGTKPFTPTEESLRRDWDRLASIPDFAALREKVPFMATWDNHDYGSHNGGAEFELKETAKAVFLDFFGEPEDSERRTTPGIYDARVFGPPGKRVQIILLDTRWFKGPFVKDPRTKEQKEAAGLSGSMGNYLPNEDPDVSLLGDTQWDWLEAQLGVPAEARLIASGTQVIPDQKAMDEWGNYPHERQRLFDLIRDTRADGVLLLSGNVHFSEVSQLDGLVYPLIEFTASGMTHNNEAYARAENAYRIAGPYAENNFGIVEFDWDAEPAPTINLRIVDLEGRDVFRHRIGLDALRHPEAE